MQRSLRPTFLLFLVIAFIDYMGMGLVYPIFSSMLFHPHSTFLPADVSEGLRGLYLGLLLATMPTVQFFVAPILGLLSDQKGRRKVLVSTLALGSLGYVISYLAVLSSSLPLLVLSRVFVGIAGGNMSAVSAGIVDISTPENKSKNFGLLNMAWGLGFAIGPFLGGILAPATWGGAPFAAPFLVAGSMMLLGMMGALVLLRETHRVPTHRHLSLAQGLHNLRAAFRKPGLGLLLCGGFLAFFGWGFYYQFIPISWIHQYGLTATTIGILSGYAALFYAVSSGLFIRPIVNAFSPHLVVLASMPLMVITIWLFLFPLPSIWLWVILPIQNFAVALFYPTLTTLVSNAGNEDNQGELLGILQSIAACAFAIAPLCSGLFLSWSTHAPAFLGGAIMLCAAVIFGQSFRNRARS